MQINPGIVGLPDSGTVVIDGCAFPAENVPITPNLSFPGAGAPPGVAGAGRARYNVTITNCCGEVFSFITP